MTAQIEPVPTVCWAANRGADLVPDHVRLRIPMQQKHRRTITGDGAVDADAIGNDQLIGERQRHAHTAARNASSVAVVDCGLLALLGLTESGIENWTLCIAWGANCEGVRQMKLRRAITGAVVACDGRRSGSGRRPARLCRARPVHGFGYPSGRTVYADNDNNGGGAYVTATLCWQSRGNGYYNTFVTWDVTDTLANGAGATIRMEWTGTDGDTHYDVRRRASALGRLGPPPTATGSGATSRTSTSGLVLTSTNSEAHHCGPRW